MQADGAERPRGATVLSATAAAALVGPYPIDEDALRKLKRSHDAGVIDDHTFRRRKAEALGLAEPTAFADARSMDVDAIVDDAPGEDDAAISAGEEPPQAYMYYARRGDIREGVEEGACGPANFREADGALLLEAPFGKVGGARVVIKGIQYVDKYGDKFYYAPKLRVDPNYCSHTMEFQTDFGYKLKADLPTVTLSLYSAHHLDANGEEILMGLYSYHTRERTELLYWFKANDTHDWPESTYPPEIRLVRFDPAPISRWHDLVNHHVLPTVCVFLDASTMGLLEMCGKGCLGEREWNSKAAGIPRGALATMSSKLFLAAHTRVQALAAGQKKQRIDLLEEPGFDEFAFTLVLSWGEDHRVTAAFPYMSLTPNGCSPCIYGCMRNYDCRVSPNAEGQAIIAAKLLELGRNFDDYEVQEFLMSWDPSITLICTRKSDGASVKIDNFSNYNEDWTIKQARPTTHPLTTKTYFGGQAGFYVKFTHGDLPLRDFQMELFLPFDISTGRIIAVCLAPHYSDREEANDDGSKYEGHMKEDLFYMFLHKWLDASLRV